jgi:DNA-binding NarL/FixJ family response regulator
VLVVDDQKPFRRVVGEVARATAGFAAAVAACSGEEAVRVARDVRPDLVLVDVRMPGLDGVATSRRVADVVPEAAIRLVSADDPPWSTRAPPACGAVAFMRKQDLCPRTLRAVWHRHGRRADTGAL